MDPRKSEFLVHNDQNSPGGNGPLGMPHWWRIYRAAVLRVFIGPCSECLPQHVIQVSTGSRTVTFLYMCSQMTEAHTWSGPTRGQGT